MRFEFFCVLRFEFTLEDAIRKKSIQFQVKIVTLKSAFRTAYMQLNQAGGLIESTFTQPEESIDSDSESSHPPKRVSFENFDLFAPVNDDIFHAFGPKKANH